MAERYDRESHRRSIADMTDLEPTVPEATGEQATAWKNLANATDELAKGQKQQVQVAARVEGYNMLALNEILDGVNEINAKLDEIPVRPIGPIFAVLEAGLKVITNCDVRDVSVRAELKIIEFMADNESRVSQQLVADAIASIPVAGMRGSAVYADAVFEVVRRTVLEPGRNLPHRMLALEEARRIIASADQCARPQPPGPGGCGGGPMAPSLCSTEILRDVSHLTTLLLGSSPAFADAMRMQSDALAYSLAAFNKVGDMQRQDALGLAITARAAAEELNRR